MSRSDLEKCSVKSPSGQVVRFDFQDLEASVDKKSAVFESAVGNGTYVQSNGHTSGRFPLACIFGGDDYSRKADAFLSALLEDGEFVLSHPIHGDVNVVPVGQITIVDPVVSGAGQVIVNVTFYETTGLQVGESGGLPQVFDSLVQASALDFSDKAALEDPVDKESFKNKVDSMCKDIAHKMSKASGAIQSVTQSIEDTGDSIGRGLDLLIGEPLHLARQVQILIGEPRRQNSAVNAKLGAYQSLATHIFSGTLAEPSEYSKEAINTFHLNKLAAQSIVGNMAMLMVESKDYLTKADYIEAALRIDALLSDYQIWVDANFDSLEIDDLGKANTDTGDGLAELQQLVFGVMSDLVARSFTAKTEMRETLQSDRALIELCFSKMGSAEGDTLDLFVAINNLEMDEILMVPKGREIVWHV